MIAFVVYATMNLYHDVVMEQYLLNYGILQKDKEAIERDFSASKSRLTMTDKATPETKAFRFFEVLGMKYLCCHSKKSGRFRRYRELIKIIAERMDIC